MHAASRLVFTSMVRPIAIVTMLPILIVTAGFDGMMGRVHAAPVAAKM